MSESRQGRITPWAFAGVAAMMAVLAVVWRYGQAEGPAQALALKASRVDLVGQMQIALTSAAEAEKSAVLAATDEESQAAADRSRAATVAVEQRRLELARLLEAGGTEAERALLVRFAEDFAALRAVDSLLTNEDDAGGGSDGSDAEFCVRLRGGSRCWFSREREIRGHSDMECFGLSRDSIQFGHKQHLCCLQVRTACSGQCQVTDTVSVTLSVPTSEVSI
jgi:hypothetical protein